MGITETLKGAVKRTAGDLLGDEKLQTEGKAQQEKGEAETKAAQHRAAATVDEKAAESFEGQARQG
jgi:uncharacterized protein YjbJ (UPF0337 family)